MGMHTRRLGKGIDAGQADQGGHGAREEVNELGRGGVSRQGKRERERERKREKERERDRERGAFDGEA